MYVRITEGGPILIFGLRLPRILILELYREDYFILYWIFRSAQKNHNGTTESRSFLILRIKDRQNFYFGTMNRGRTFSYTAFQGPTRNSILELQMADHSLCCILSFALGLLY